MTTPIFDITEDEFAEKFPEGDYTKAKLDICDELASQIVAHAESAGISTYILVLGEDAEGNGVGFESSSCAINSKNMAVVAACKWASKHFEEILPKAMLEILADQSGQFKNVPHMNIDNSTDKDTLQ